MMRTSASGMNAQSNRLGAIADNVANSNTVGYKRASTEFSSIILDSGLSEYQSGSVATQTRYAISEQGSFNYTTSVTDLAVQGNGFFLVSDGNGAAYLTRAGSFVPNADGTLVNAGGFNLLGYKLTDGAPSVVANGTAGLETVNLGDLALRATPSTLGQFFVNLPSDAAIIPAGSLPSDNVAGSQYTAKTSLIAYGNLGEEITLDVYYAKSATGTWEIAVFDRAAAATGGGFPYSSGPLATETLTFNPANGGLVAGSTDSISIPIPGGQTLELDLAQTSQLATDYTVITAQVNGNVESDVDRVEISEEGIMYAVFENGARVAAYQIPLADVISPDNLKPLAGNVFTTTTTSGDLQIGFANGKGFGTMLSGALEQSNVDVANELTDMIEAQRNYTINSKVFQTGSELLEVLANLKR